jgi:hypothetical protein
MAETGDLPELQPKQAMIAASNSALLRVPRATDWGGVTPQRIVYSLMFAFFRIRPSASIGDEK